MTDDPTFLDSLIEAVERAARYNPEEYAPPSAVLWPDGAREWEPLLPIIAERLPVLTLGTYDPANRTGSSYWVRSMLAGVLADKLPDDQVPIVYLPGVAKQDLRAVEDCPQELQPIASLQYEGVLFTQTNGKDWSIRAFIESKDGGLGISVAGDRQTKDAAQRALLKLSAVPVETLRKQAPLRAAFFDALLNPDDALNLLTWLNDPEEFRKLSSLEEWDAFSSVCESKYGFGPDTDGQLKAAQSLGERMEPAWEIIWTRFVEAPANYPKLPGVLNRARPSKDAGLFARQDSWPQDNEAAEKLLRSRLLEVGGMMPAPARAEILQLNEPRAHGQRRQWVWATLGLSPLALALEPLAEIAKLTESALTGANTNECAQAYAERGWQADGAELRALALVDHPDDIAAVQAVVRAVYRPWLEETAKQFQSVVGEGGARYTPSPLPQLEKGTCLMFVDGLRMDLAQWLSEALIRRGMRTDVGWRLAALPTVTATAKPAVSPVAGNLKGGSDLSPSTAGGRTLDVTVLRTLLREADYQVLGPNDLLGDPNGLAWTEAGELDENGHTKGAGLVRQLDAQLREIERRIATLLDEGWSKVVVVTDHGFLLMPGGLPKVELAQHLAVTRKGRCARLQPLSVTDYQTVPWHWDEAVRVAMAPGIACFAAGKEYEHGGISPQECVTPVLTVSKTVGVGLGLAIDSVVWTGLRCRTNISGATEGFAVDLRKEPANPASSVAGGGRPLDADGKASLLVEDDGLLGENVYLVLLGPTGALVLQTEATVGET